MRKWLFAPKSIFRVGDTVQLIGGDNEFMSVIEICSEPGMKVPLIHCQFSSAGGLVKNLFPEGKLEPFDWYLADRNRASNPGQIQEPWAGEALSNY